VQAQEALGRDVAAAWSMTASDEVFVAKTASGLAIWSTVFHISSFSGQRLGDRLDDQIAVGEVLVGRRRLDPREDRVGVLLRGLALLDRALRAAW
jgi:hypothetical protein